MSEKAEPQEKKNLFEGFDEKKKISVIRVLIILLLLVAIPMVFLYSIHAGIILILFVLGLFGVNTGTG